MTRLAIDLDSDLELLLRLEAERRHESIAETLRSLVRAHFADRRFAPPPGCGEFESDRGDLAERHEERLHELGFGRE
jgi:hypothetical protein